MPNTWNGGPELSIYTVCAWFAACTNTAQRYEAHPILGDVPICNRCKAMLDSQPERV